MRFTIPLIATALVAAIAAVTDLRTGRIPNWLTLGSLPFILLLHVALGASRAGVRGAASGALVAVSGLIACGLGPLLFYRFAGMGGGDVKLFAAVGALSGPLIGLQIQLCAYLVFALYVPASLLYEGRLFSVLGELVAGLRNALRPKRDRKPSPPAWKMSFRLGPAIFLATLATALGYRMY